MMMNDKRGVSGVVTAVLLILLVIAAIAILWVVIQNFVKDTTDAAVSQADCFGTQLIISNAIATQSTVTVLRQSGDITLTEVKVIVNPSGGGASATQTISALGVGESGVATFGTALASGDSISAVAVIGGKDCPVSDTFAVA